MSTNSRIAKVYPKHFDPNPEKVWEKFESVNQQEQEDEEDNEFDLSDLTSDDEWFGSYLSAISH